MINQLIHDLLEHNRAKFGNSPIAFDGVVDEEAYLSSAIRTAFLLKDVNDEKMEKDWEYMTDLRSHVLNASDTLYKTWPNACLWIELLKNPECQYSDCITADENFNAEKLRENLLSVSIVNLKKTPGGGSSVDEEIRKAIQDCKLMLKEELSIIKPRLVICGGTFEYAKQLFDVTETCPKMLPCGAHYFIIESGVFVNTKVMQKSA